MRINVYSQELTDETALEVTPTKNGKHYSGVRLYLHSAEQLHHEPGDDDRSAVTFWLPQSAERRESLAVTFEKMAAWVRDAPPEVAVQ